MGARVSDDDDGGCAVEERIALLAAAGYATSVRDPETGSLYWTLTSTCPPGLRDDIISAVRRVQARPRPHPHRRPAPSRRPGRAVAAFLTALGVTSVGAGVSMLVVGVARPAGGVEGPAHQARPTASIAVPDIGTTSVDLVPADSSTTPDTASTGRHRKPSTPPHVERIAAHPPSGRHRKVDHKPAPDTTRSQSGEGNPNVPPVFLGHAIEAHAEQAKPSAKASTSPEPAERPIGCEDAD